MEGNRNDNQIKLFAWSKGRKESQKVQKIVLHLVEIGIISQSLGIPLKLCPVFLKQPRHLCVALGEGVVCAVQKDLTFLMLPIIQIKLFLVFFSSLCC